MAPVTNASIVARPADVREALLVLSASGENRRDNQKSSGASADAPPKAKRMQATKIRPKVYTVAEIAQMFVVSPRVVRDLIRKGELPALRIGRTYRIPRKAADAYLARAMPPAARAAAKSRIRLDDEQSGFLFPVGTLQ